MYNTIRELMNFFSTPRRPVDKTEFLWFWMSLSPEEQNELQTTPLS